MHYQTRGGRGERGNNIRFKLLPLMIHLLFIGRCGARKGTYMVEVVVVVVVVGWGRGEIISGPWRLDCANGSIGRVGRRRPLPLVLFVSLSCGALLGAPAFSVPVAGSPGLDEYI